jgi:hypothetical protein
MVRVSIALIAFLLAGLLNLAAVTPASAESQPRQRYRAYLKELYYAKQLKQVSQFYIKNMRVPMDELLGSAERDKLIELKKGYVYKPVIETELLDGNVCKMTGSGIAQANGIQCTCKLDLVMRYEEGNWKIQLYAWRGSVPGHY